MNCNTTHYRANSSSVPGDPTDAVENALLELKRPSFGHYVRALAMLDQFLGGFDDPYALGLAIKRVNPAAVRLYQATGVSNPKQVSFTMLLSRVVEIRNREKGHGYTGQYDARAATTLLHPALVELLEQLPLLVARPLVWIERIEYLSQDKWIITFLELMGTQRARRMTRDVKTPGGLQPRFIYMWNGESAPLQLTPFVHLEETGQDEVVYVLAGIAGEPTYQARGMEVERRPDQLLSQLGERAPFLLRSEPTVTTSRAPDAAKHYRMAVEVALADGVVTPAEATRLEAARIELGLAEAEAQQIHEQLGWTSDAGVAQPMTSVARDEATPTTGNVAAARTPVAPVAVSTAKVEPVPAAHDRNTAGAHGWPQAGWRLAARMRELVGERLGFEPELVMFDEDLDVGDGELWIQLQDARGVSLWYAARRADEVRVAIGFYSQNRRRDPAYRRARAAITEDGGPPLPGGWSALSERSRAATKLALETGKWFPIDQVGTDPAMREVGGLLIALAQQAAAALGEADEEPERATPLEVVDAPVAADVPDDFELRPLHGDPRIHGSVWIARILWALEWARRNDPAPKSAADIARILTANGVRVPPTNTARAFRVPRDDPRRTELCEVKGDQRYVISPSGRRALFELLATLDG